MYVSHIPVDFFENSVLLSFEPNEPGTVRKKERHIDIEERREREGDTNMVVSQEFASYDDPCVLLLRLRFKVGKKNKIVE